MMLSISSILVKINMENHQHLVVYYSSYSFVQSKTVKAGNKRKRFTYVDLMGFFFPPLHGSL